MYRGTTPTLTLTFPIEVSLIKKAYITFRQKNIIKLEKTLADCEIDSENPNIVLLPLSQEETLKFDEGIVYCQARCIFNDSSNTTMATTIEELYVEDVLKEGVIT